jgi:NAD(P)-dependent dehydrogenase (short-subunit alcohol dehydrogenase family)
MKRMNGKRVVITQVSAVMGKDLVDLFGAEGADLLSDDRGSGGRAGREPRDRTAAYLGPRYGRCRLPCDVRGDGLSAASARARRVTVDDRAPARQDRGGE